MAFSADTIRRAFARSKGQCECSRKGHDWHTARCPKTFTEGSQGTSWEAHHRVSVDAGGTDSLDNCEILCIRCHSAIPK